MPMSVNQATKFISDLKAVHDTTFKRLFNHLLGALDKGLEFKPDATKGLETFVDAEFAGACNSSTTDDPTSVYSRTSFIIKCQNFPIL